MNTASKTRRAARTRWLACAALLIGCAPRAHTPSAQVQSLGEQYARMLQWEGEGRTEDALALALDMADSIGAIEGEHGATAAAALCASLTDSLALPGVASGLAFRAGTLPRTAQRLQRHADRASSATARPVLQRCAEQLHAALGTQHASDGARRASGCVERATVTAPFAALQRALHDDRGLAAAGSSWPEATTTPLGATLSDQISEGAGCMLRPLAASAEPGVRQLAVDVDVRGESELFVHVRGEAVVLHAGGAHVVLSERQANTAPLYSVTQLKLEGQSLRLLLNSYSASGGEPLELYVVDTRGRPLPTAPVRAGSRADATVHSAQRLLAADPTQAAARALIARGLLDRGELDRADALLADDSSAPAAHSALWRLQLDRELPESEQLDRALTPLKSLQLQWKNDWRAQLLYAENLGARRGQAERALATLKALTPHVTQSSPLELRAAAWKLARAARQFERASELESGLPAPGSPWLAALRAGEQETLPAVRLEAFCGAARALQHDRNCFDELSRQGQLERADAELERLRALTPDDRSLPALALRLALNRGELEKARALLRSLPRGEQPLDALLDDQGRLGARAALLRDAPQHLGALDALAPVLSRGEGDDAFARRFAERAQALVQQDRTGAQPGLEGPTVVLLHEEQYAIEDSGLLQYWLGDVRRLSGVADVEERAEAAWPRLHAPSHDRIVLRQVIKRDGSASYPEPSPTAAQAHADLTQLEAGDYVVSIYRGFALPDALGAIGFDSPDLRPARTVVREARLSAEWPSALAPQWKLHPGWGAATAQPLGARVRVQAEQRNLDVQKRPNGAPPSERTVHLSWSTLRPERLASALADEADRLTRPDHDLRQFTHKALSQAKLRPGPREVRAQAEALSRAIGERLSDGGFAQLADHMVTQSYGENMQTARATLASRSGSRSVLLSGAWRALGLAHSLHLAERQPHADPADYPLHVGRFVRPLLRLEPQGDLREPLWFDVDVAGPPLAAGTLSPELRGRHALDLSTGQIAPLPTQPFEISEDEIDVRLQLDADGNAQGEIVLRLHGELAQALRGEFERSVGQERERTLRTLVSAWIAGATVTEAAIADESALLVRARFEVNGYAARERTGGGPNALRLPGHLALHLYAGTMQGSLLERFGAPLAQGQPLSIGTPVRYHLRRTVELPQGYEIASLGGAADTANPAALAQRAFQVRGATLSEDVRLSIPAQSVTGEQGAALLQALRDADDALAASLLLRPAR